MAVQGGQPKFCHNNMVDDVATHGVSVAVIINKHTHTHTHTKKSVEYNLKNKKINRSG